MHDADVAEQLAEHIEPMLRDAVIVGVQQAEAELLPEMDALRQQIAALEAALRDARIDVEVAVAQNGRSFARGYQHALDDQMNRRSSFAA